MNPAFRWRAGLKSHRPSRKVNTMPYQVTSTSARKPRLRARWGPIDRGMQRDLRCRDTCTLIANRITIGRRVVCLTR